MTARSAAAVVTSTEDYARGSPVLARLGGKLSYALPGIRFGNPCPGRSAELRRRLAPNGEAVIGIAGRMAADKGFDHLLDALPLVLREAPGVVVIDVDPSALRRARASRAHRCLVRADAAPLPFPSGYFGAIACNSVFERIPDIEQAVSECARTLRMGGRLFITAASHRFGERLLGAAIARRIGLDRLARGYAGWFNRPSRHFHTDGSEVWSARLQRHGLAIRTVQTYLTADALRAFDLAHYLRVPRLVCYRLTGRWTLSSNPPLNRLFDAWLRPHYPAAFPTTDGPYICLEATK